MAEDYVKFNHRVAHSRLSFFATPQWTFGEEIMGRKIAKPVDIYIKL